MHGNEGSSRERPLILSAPSGTAPSRGLHDNPILARERRRFLRSIWTWIALVIIAWFPLMLITRSQLGSGALPAQWWQQIILLCLSTALRPDVLIGFFLIYRLTSETQWAAMREEIAVTLLTVRQVLIGKAWVPIMVLFFLNVMAGVFYYGSMAMDKQLQLYIPTEEEKRALRRWEPFVSSIDAMSPEDIDMVFGRGSSDYLTTQTLQSRFTAAGASMTVGSVERKGITIPVAIPIAVLALVEDLLFAAIVVFVALRQYLVRRNALSATFISIAWVGLIGLGILGCYLAPLLVFELLPYYLQDQVMFSIPLEFLFMNSVWFLCVLPFELLMLYWCHHAALKALRQWMYSEDGLPLQTAKPNSAARL